MEKQKEFCYRFSFHKSGSLIFISHLDLLRLFQRALRRAGLPFVLSGGFSPRIKMRLDRALKLGVEGKDLWGEFALACELPGEQVLSRLSEVLPEGIDLCRLNFESGKKF